jgi:hypothetical protein
MKKNLLFIFIILLIFPNCVYAQRGCCSHHGGVAGCSSTGRQICNDGTLSPSCTCTASVSYIYGCTDKSAMNYNSQANKDNGSCIYYTYGCTDKSAKNYNINADKDDGSCIYYKYGCTNKDSINYDETAEIDDGNCIPIVYGCTDETAKNYNVNANKDDNSCEYNVSKESNIVTEETTDNSSDTSNDALFGTGIMGIVVYILYKIKK